MRHQWRNRTVAVRRDLKQWRNDVNALDKCRLRAFVPKLIGALDPSRALTLSDVLSPPYASQKWYLQLSAMLGEDFDLYVLPVAESGAGPESAAKLVAAQYFTGLDDFRRYVWSVNLPENQPIDLYMRATNGSSIVVVSVEFVNSDVMIASSNQNGSSAAMRRRGYG